MSYFPKSERPYLSSAIILGSSVGLFLLWKKYCKEKNLPPWFYHPFWKDENFDFIRKSVGNGTLPKVMGFKENKYCPHSFLFPFPGSKTVKQNGEMKQN